VGAGAFGVEDDNRDGSDFVRLARMDLDAGEINGILVKPGKR
jgi:hypothetical protein